MPFTEKSFNAFDTLIPEQKTQKTSTGVLSPRFDWTQLNLSGSLAVKVVKTRFYALGTTGEI